jgi:hypothetical protein
MGNWFRTFWDNAKVLSSKFFSFILTPFHVSPSTITLEVVLKTITSHLDVNSWPGIDAKKCLFRQLFLVWHHHTQSYSLYKGNSICKLQMQVATYVFELSAGNCHC